jgi:hypothetical protein
MLNNNVELIPEINLENGSIKHISIINNKENKPIWDMFEVRLSNGINCNVVAEHNCIQTDMPQELIKKFVIDRLQELMKKENKDDCVFLGTIYQQDGKYKFTRHYNSFYCESGKTAQEMFDIIYPSLNYKNSNNKTTKNDEQFDDEYIYFVHATEGNNIDSIFKDGLKNFRGNHLGSTLRPISKRDNQDSLEKYSYDYAKNSGRRYVYIVKIPKRYYCYINRYGEKYEMPVFKQTKSSDGLHGNMSYFINNLVYGVFDSLNPSKGIIKNALYNTKYNPNGLSYSVEQLDQMKDDGLDLTWYESRTGIERDFNELKEIDDKLATYKIICEHYNIPYSNNISNKAIKDATRSIDLSSAKNFIQKLFKKKEENKNVSRL